MKKLLIATGCAAFLCILITSAAASYGTGNNGDMFSSGGGTGYGSSDASPPSCYTLKAYRQKVAAFRDNSREPFFVSTVNVSDLPGADQVLLTKGITTSNRREFLRLMEDYCS